MKTPPVPRFLDTVLVCAMVLSFQDHAGVVLCLSSRSLGGLIRTHTLILSWSPSAPSALLRLGFIMAVLEVLRLSTSFAARTIRQQGGVTHVVGGQVRKCSGDNIERVFTWTPAVDTRQRCSYLQRHACSCSAFPCCGSSQRGTRSWGWHARHGWFVVGLQPAATQTPRKLELAGKMQKGAQGDPKQATTYPQHFFSFVHPNFILCCAVYSLVLQPSVTREVSSEMASEEASSKEVLCYGFNQVRNGGEKMKFVFIRN